LFFKKDCPEMPSLNFKSKHVSLRGMCLISVSRRTEIHCEVADCDHYWRNIPARGASEPSSGTGWK
jgi:hypothetical protein